MNLPLWQQVLCTCQGVGCCDQTLLMQAPKSTDSLDLVFVSLDSGLVSLLKLAQISLASRETVDEVRVLLLLSCSPVCLQLHLLLPCLHDTLTLLVWQPVQESLAYVRSSIWYHLHRYRCTTLFLMGLSLRHCMDIKRMFGVCNKQMAPLDQSEPPSCNAACKPNRLQIR